MNIERMDFCINLMKEVAASERLTEHFNMDVFQSKLLKILPHIEMEIDEYVPTQNREEFLNTCGTAACFAGYLGMTDEWKKVGGTIKRDGVPILSNFESAETAIGYFLDIPKDLATEVIYPSKLLYNAVDLGERVTPDDIVEVLIKIRDECSHVVFTSNPEYGLILNYFK